MTNPRSIANFITFVTKAHKDDKYGEYPYFKHLRDVFLIAMENLHLLEPNQELDVLMGCYGHDLIEMSRATYNDILLVSNTNVAEICRALTPYNRGRNRKERMPDLVYEDIRNTPGATFVKLCDRIANVNHSIKTGSGHLKMYGKEHEHFKRMLNFNPKLESLWKELDKKFEKYYGR